MVGSHFATTASSSTRAGSSSSSGTFACVTAGLTTTSATKFTTSVLTATAAL